MGEKTEKTVFSKTLAFSPRGTCMEIKKNWKKIRAMSIVRFFLSFRKRGIKLKNV